jgi:hypothetical protein
VRRSFSSSVGRAAEDSMKRTVPGRPGGDKVKRRLQRALLYHDALGSQETFSPYAEPDAGWWEQPARVGEMR